MTSSSCWLGRSDLCSPITARACFSRNAPNILSPKDCLVRSCLSATPSALHSWIQILASYGMIGQTAMGQVKISTLCRQGSILETLFVPHSGLRPRRRRTGEGPKKRLETTLIVTETLLPAPGCAGRNRVWRIPAGSSYDPARVRETAMPPGRVVLRPARRNGPPRKRAGRAEELPSESRLSFPASRSQASRSLVSLWCGRAASSGILSVVL